MGSYDGPFKFLLAKIPLYNTYLINCSPILCFGSGIGLGAYFVQTQRISWEAFWGTLPFGIMLFSIITINEIPDYLEDRRAGKLNLVARFGREIGVWLFILSLCAAYGAILAGVILKRIPFLGLISLLTLPIAWKTVSILRTHYREPIKMAPANFGMICIHNFTAILLILAYFIEGFRWDTFIASFLPLTVLIIIYIPIASLIWGRVSSQKQDESQGVIVQT